jgi:bifunctional non-homologous end joining protein LigD
MPETFTHHGHSVEISHPDKIYFPEEHITKLEIVEYYQKIGERMLPFLKGRPLSMLRFPDGIEGQGFFQKQVPDHFPEWLPRVTVEKKEDGTHQELVSCDNLETLIYLANQGCLEFHTWLSKADKLDYPDKAVIDLDPSDDNMKKVREAARVLVRELQDREIEVQLMTSGSSGYHLITPLNSKRTFDEVRADWKELTVDVAEAHPDLLTTEQRKAKRGNRVYLDIARNAYAQTSICPYSVRARKGAPVAAPLRLDELDDSEIHPRKYGVQNLFRRLSQLKRAPWEG